MLKEVPDRFYGSSITISELAKQLGGGDGMLERLFLRPHQNEPMASYWGSVTDHWMKRSVTSREKPDICLWGSGCLLLNLRAYYALGEQLSGQGEFLPITVDLESMFVFNCLTWGKEDMGLTETQYVDGYEDGIATLAFEPDDIATKLVFKSKLAGAGLVFASHAFKELIEAHQLQGLRFDADLMNPF
ncbi:MAG: hypothetical protein KA754_00875 [Corallincola sp.]|nr:hypothetical protein [Corallincola sp.]